MLKVYILPISGSAKIYELEVSIEMNSAFEKWLKGWVYGLIKNIDIKESVGVKRQ